MIEENMPRSTTSDAQNQPKAGSPTEELMLCECEEALFRIAHPSPSPREEWKVLEARLSKKKRIRRILSVTISALAAALVTGVVWFISIPSDTSTPTETNMTVLVESKAETDSPVIEESVPAHKPKAITLPSGSETQKAVGGIVLTRKEADYTSVSDNAIRQNIVSIPRGNVYKIILNDGTEVWLNASSRLFFPTRFTGTCRSVKLEGEAYFKVAPDKEHPFIIQTEKMSTEVLGTEFNVKAYPGSDAHVTLVNGSVKVHLPQLKEDVVLRPGDDIACAADSYLVQQVDISYYTQWMEGYFYYDDVPLTDILKDLGRWYNVTIAIEQDSFLLNQRLHFVADRSEDISQTLKNLNGYPYLSATKEGNRVVVCRKRNH